MEDLKQQQRQCTSKVIYSNRFNIDWKISDLQNCLHPATTHHQNNNFTAKQCDNSQELFHRCLQLNWEVHEQHQPLPENSYQSVSGHDVCHHHHPLVKSSHLLTNQAPAIIITNKCCIKLSVQKTKQNYFMAKIIAYCSASIKALPTKKAFKWLRNCVDANHDLYI